MAAALEVLESFEGTEEHAVGGIDAPLNASKGIEGVLVGMAERGIVLDGGVEEFFPGEVFVEAFDLVFQSWASMRRRRRWAAC